MIRNLSGWKRQRFDPRDTYYLPSKRRLASLPPTIDLSSGLGPYLDQGNAGSCGPNSSAELVNFDDQAEQQPQTTISRLHLYYWTRYLQGTTGSDSGVDNRSMMKALQQYGVCPETLWPYELKNLLAKPSDAANNAAMQDRITDYAAVVQNLTQMKGVIRSGKPFLFGFDVFPQIQSDQAAATGIIADPSPSDSPIGGHDMSLCGFTDKDLPGVKPGNKWPSGTFKLRQHWTNSDGSPWGDGGYGYISYAYATGQHAGDFWLINSVPVIGQNPTPSPTPTPTPTPPVPGNPIPAIKAKIDALLAALEQQFSWYPSLATLLARINVQVDAILALYALKRLELGLVVPPSVLAVVNAALDAVAVEFPAEAAIISIVKSMIPLILAWIP